METGVSSLSIGLRHCTRWTNEATLMAWWHAGTGYVSFEEFCTIVRKKISDDEEEREMRDMFRILDKEKRGEVNTNELRSAFLRVYLRCVSTTDVAYNARIRSCLRISIANNGCGQLQRLSYIYGLYVYTRVYGRRLYVRALRVINWYIGLNVTVSRSKMCGNFQRWVRAWQVVPQYAIDCLSCSFTSKIDKVCLYLYSCDNERRSGCFKC